MTIKEAKEVFVNRGFINGVFDGDKWRESVVIISKWLEQESILDKIRTEIEKETDRDDHADDYYDGMRKALAIIDKYKAESEPQESVTAEEVGSQNE